MFCGIAKDRIMEKKNGLTFRRIFRYLMEERYYPQYEKTHILFELDGNLAVLEYEEGILSVRLFFSIDEDAYDNFLEASNMCMLKCFIVKPAILNDGKTIMFSCEHICENFKDFSRFFPRMISELRQGLKVHKAQMKEILLSEEVAKAALPAVEEGILGAGSGRKVLS